MTGSLENSPHSWLTRWALRRTVGRSVIEYGHGQLRRVAAAEAIGSAVPTESTCLAQASDLVVPATLPKPWGRT